MRSTARTAAGAQGADGLEDLFQEALNDFLPQAPALAVQQPQRVSRPADIAPTLAADNPDSPINPAPQPIADTAPVSARQTTAPAGLGRGLGSQLPGRPSKQSPRPTSLYPPPTRVAEVPASAEASQQGPAASAAPPLQPHMQHLADEIMKMIADSQGTGEPNSQDDEAMDGELQMMRAFMEQMQLDPSKLGDMGGMGGMGMGGHDAEDETDGEASAAVRSDAVRRLMQQTKKTVEEQSKFARGEGPPTARRPGPGGGAAGAGFPFPGGGPAGNPLADLMRSLGDNNDQDSGLPGGFLTNMIFKNLLLSKDMLYAPLQDIRSKYPPWLAAHASELSPADLARYQAQQASIDAVLLQYDTDPENTARVLELISEMQSHGQPPPDIVAELGPDLEPRGAAEDNDVTEPFNFEGLPPDFLENLSPDLLNNLPPDVLRNLPKDMQQECSLM